MLPDPKAPSPRDQLLVPIMNNQAGMAIAPDAGVYQPGLFD